jgi:hypothetical protein
MIGPLSDLRIAESYIQERFFDDLPGSTNRRPGSPILCPGASRKTKNAGHSAQNDALIASRPGWHSDSLITPRDLNLTS